MKVKLFTLLLLLFVVFNIGLGSFGLSETSEARYAEISKEMVISGDYLHPTLLGIKHYHKPPLTYYISSLGYAIFGINEFGARFFLGIALLLQIYLVFRIGYLLLKDEKIAYASAVIYSSFPIVLIAVRNLTTDAFLVTFILWSIYLWLKYQKSKKPMDLYGFFTVLGLAFLTKGPVGLIPSLLFIVCYKFYYKEKIKFSLPVLFGAILTLAISGSWFLAIILDDPKVWDYFIQEQIINRATNADQFHRSQPIWYYLLLAPVLGLPWVIFIITYLLKKIKLEWKQSLLLKIILSTSVLLFILFSLFSSKLILYILPIFPFIALLGGMLLYKFSKKQLGYFIKCYYALFIILILALIFSFFYAEIEVNYLQTSFIIFLAIACLLYFLKVSKQNTTSKLLQLSVGFIVCLLLVHTTFASSNPNIINSFKSISKFIQQEKGGTISDVIVYDDLLPSAKFYLNSSIITVHDNNYKTIREIQFEHNTTYKKNIINLKDPSGLSRFKHLFQGRDHVYIERKKSPLNDSLSYLLETFTHKVEKGKWVIYY
ncbi:4-amino-4-deoxy-L-arabinose transferase [Gillisia sp. Hel_I_86]|uniref:ArnT family glycosyltransferase n=1 Tax=Gillisia sp. Hel_I_86 TaxID=1249981 RepID=UPI001199E55E|nr:glycosyltransferase family 39 protein [Gillisia sp. Hel_I_86]TVZ27682.1 4-amino-4-deoxy-L-arabinose transferase [Gillisia sp. Hel_I_86]